MVTKEEAKEQIKKIIEKFEKLNSEGKLNNLNEENTKSWFIEPLFNALGWDVHSQEVTKEERVSKGRADYAFRLNGVIRFFLEAKKLKEDLNESKFAKQTIEYGWNKGITWAVLTDFEGLKVFNCEWNEKDFWRNVLIDLNYRQFLEEFDQIWLLSKESFQNDDIGKYADKTTKRIPRKKISDYLLSEFIDWRTKLLGGLKKEYQKYSEEERDEIVQTFLDRLIFIRNCEDRGFEEKKLDAALREFVFKKKNLNNSLKEIFRYYDVNYDSKIFELREVDKVDFSDHLLRNILDRIYKTQDQNIAYDFSLIDADILGNLYEQYLTYISKKSEEKNKAKRKEQGIYYTPTYIVDYIVRNTLGELLKDKKVNAEKIRVLDPACGSGSFLIKAFDALYDYSKGGEKVSDQSKFEGGEWYSTKEKILKNNIFGVDLDKQAVEIAQLNLLLKIAEKGHKLPILRKNIQNGNSLIDDESIAGDKAFNWNERFKQIMDEGGFDVVIGNPPYVRIQTLNKKDIKFFNTKYRSAEKGNYDIYVLFVERALNLLKKGGYVGLILPNKFFTSKYGEPLRKLISEGRYLYKIVNFGDQQVFENATTYTCLLFLRKQTNCKFNLFKVDDLDAWKIGKKSEQRVFDAINATSAEWNFTVGKKANIFEKLNIINTKLKDVTEKIYQGPITSADTIYLFKNFKNQNNKGIVEVFSKEQNEWVKIESQILKHVVRSGDIGRYNAKPTAVVLFPYEIIKNTARLLTPNELKNNYPLAWNYLNFHKKTLESREQGSFKDERWYRFGRTQNLGLWEQKKLMLPYMVTKLSAYLDLDEHFYFINVTTGGYGIVANEHKINYTYLCGILNSKLLDFYFKQISTNFHGGYFAANKQYIENLPIKLVSHPQQQPLIKLVDKMLSLNKRLNEFGDKKTDERARIEEEIKETDTKIDELVYRLYSITEEEKKIIEESLKK